MGYRELHAARSQAPARRVETEGLRAARVGLELGDDEAVYLRSLETGGGRGLAAAPTFSRHRRDCSHLLRERLDHLLDRAHAQEETKAKKDSSS